MDQICNNEDNFDVNFDDAALNNILPCPPVGGGSYQPSQALSAFNGENANGVWTLTIKDNFNQDGGSLTAWGLNICINPTPLGESHKTIWANVNPVLYPNPTTNKTTLAFSINEKQFVSITLTDITGKIVEYWMFENLNEGPHEFELGKNGLAKGIYIVQTKIDGNIFSKKLIVQ
jgi:hypothetical protein